MHTYKPVCKPNQIIKGTGNVAIVTGWTVKELMSKKLQSDQYAAIGNLYSPTRGLSPLLRNLLANPHVRFVIGLNATKEDHNSGSVRCLLDFFAHGFRPGKTDTGKECWVVNSEVTGYIDREIPSWALALLREKIFPAIANNLNEIDGILHAENRVLAPWGEPLTFPEPELEAITFPGERYGHRIEGKTIAETWVKILHRIKFTGTIRPTGYDGQWQELIDLVAVVTDEPPEFYFPEPNYLPLDRTFLEAYLPQMCEDAPYKKGVKYTYGQRIRSWFGVDQVEQIINKLIGEIDAASAVISLWDVRDHEKGGSPCLNHIWCRVVDNELSLTATFRSNDMFSAWPSNAMGLRALQKLIVEEINGRSCQELTMGPLITISQSAHIYDDCWESVDNLIATQYPKICRQREYSDPSGSFLIEAQPPYVVAHHLTPGAGEKVATYRSASALGLIRQIAASAPAIQGEHALYLGLEIQKAAIAMNNNLPYIQDRPLEFEGGYRVDGIKSAGSLAWNVLD